MKNQATTFLVSSLLLCVSVFAQSEKSNLFFGEQETTLSLHRTIKLENDSKLADITIHIKQDEPKFDLSINTVVSDGKLTIEVYDPSNTKQGSFTVGTQLDTENNELVRGNIQKSLIEPLAGNWKVKIIPSNATGQIEIQTFTAR